VFLPLTTYFSRNTWRYVLKIYLQALYINIHLITE